MVALESDIQGAVKRESLVVAALAQLQREEEEAAKEAAAVEHEAEETEGSADTQLELSGQGFCHTAAPLPEEETPADDEERDKMAGQACTSASTSRDDNHLHAGGDDSESIEDAFRRMDLQAAMSADAADAAGHGVQAGGDDGADLESTSSQSSQSRGRDAFCAGAAAAAALHHSLLSSPLATKDSQVRLRRADLPLSHVFLCGDQRARAW